MPIAEDVGVFLFRDDFASFASLPPIVTLSESLRQRLPSGLCRRNLAWLRGWPRGASLLCNFTSGVDIGGKYSRRDGLEQGRQGLVREGGFEHHVELVLL